MWPQTNLECAQHHRTNNTASLKQCEEMDRPMIRVQVVGNCSITVVLTNNLRRYDQLGKPNEGAIL